MAPVFLLFAIPFFSTHGAAQTDLLSADHTTDVLPMLPEDGEGSNAHYGHQIQIAGKEPHVNRHRHNGAEGTDDNIVCDNRCQNQDTQHHQSQFPVQRQGQAHKGRGTLAALELQIEGKDMAQHRRHTGCSSGILQMWKQ